MKKILLFVAALFIPLTALAIIALPNFPDVPSGQWYSYAIQHVALRGWMTGYANGNFGPVDNVNRAQLATVLTRYDSDVTPAINKLVTLVCLNPENFMNGLSQSLSEQEKTKYRTALDALCNKKDFDNSGCLGGFDLNTGERTGSQVCM